jgi:hypothetical protein
MQKACRRLHLYTNKHCTLTFNYCRRLYKMHTHAALFASSKPLKVSKPHTTLLLVSRLQSWLISYCLACWAATIPKKHAMPFLYPQALSPMKPPQTITASLVSAYGDVTCENQQIVVPTSTSEVAAAVKYHYNMQPTSVGGPAATGGAPVKIRVVSRARGFNATDGYRCVEQLCPRHA